MFANFLKVNFACFFANIVIFLYYYVYLKFRVFLIFGKNVIREKREINNDANITSYTVYVFNNKKGK